MKVSECSGSTLAYLGDAVFSLLVREHLIEKGYGRAKDLQRESIRYVSAKAQAHFFHALENEGFFTEDELSSIFLIALLLAQSIIFLNILRNTISIVCIFIIYFNFLRTL